MHSNITQWATNYDEVMVQAYFSKLERQKMPENVKVKASLGFYTFKLINAKADTAYNWSNLSSMQVGSHIKLSWVPDFDQNNNMFAQLYERLLPSISKCTWTKILKLHVSHYVVNASYTFKYLVKDSDVTQKRAYGHRQLFAHIAVLLDNQSGFRIRLCHREHSDEAEKFARNFVQVTNEGGKINDQAHDSVVITAQEIYHKMHIIYGCLRFTFYRYEESSRMRLECRLEKLNTEKSKSDQARELMEKLDRLLSSESKIEEHICLICFDENADGIKCSKNHIICKLCFLLYVESALEKNIGVLYESRCQIKCPSDCCEYIYSMTQIAMAGNSVMEKYNSVMRRIGELDAVNNMPKVNHDELRLKIEDALSLSCPHCFNVFYDYDGCDAVTCQKCANYFCGLCLETCHNSADAHTHAQNCKYKNEKSHYSNGDLKSKAHKQVKRVRLKVILEKLNILERQKVIQYFPSLLKDYDLQKEFAH